MAAGRSGWAAATASLQTGQQRLPPAVPRPNAGVLILEEPLAAAALPGGVLSHVEGPIHYLDLGGIQARSLADFGGASLLAGVAKLYASHSGLQSLEGLHALAAIRYLYLDHNLLTAEELLRLPELLPPGTRLLALDVAGNPGCTPEVERRLAASSPLAGAEFLNSRRLQRG